MEECLSLQGADELKPPVTTLCAMLDHAVSTAPERVALRHLDAALTYRKLGRAVAALAHYLAFFMQMRPALYFALIGLSPLTLLIDKVLPAPRFAWTASACKGASP